MGTNHVDKRYRVANGNNHVQLLQLVSAAADCKSRDDFLRLARGPIRELIPHGCMIASIGHLKFGMLIIDVAWGVDLPNGYLTEYLRDTPYDSQSLVRKCWETRRPQFIGFNNTTLDLSVTEREENERWNFFNDIAYGVFDINGRGGSFFRFSRLTASPEGECVRILEQVGPAIHQAMLRSIDNAYHSSIGKPDLSPREYEILMALIEGKSLPAMSDYFGTSQRTLQTQLSNIYRKLGVDNRVAAIAKTYEMGIDKYGMYF